MSSILLNNFLTLNSTMHISETRSILQYAAKYFSNKSMFSFLVLEIFFYHLGILIVNIKYMGHSVTLKYITLYIKAINNSHIMSIYKEALLSIVNRKFLLVFQIVLPNSKLSRRISGKFRTNSLHSFVA